MLLRNLNNIEDCIQPEDMRDFFKQRDLDIIRAYYHSKGYSWEHCHGYVDNLEDWDIERVYNIIIEELYNAIPTEKGIL